MKNNKCEMNYFEWMLDQFWNSIIRSEKTLTLILNFTQIWFETTKNALKTSGPAVLAMPSLGCVLRAKSPA